MRTNRKRIIPRTMNFTLSGDPLEPHFKRLFRFVRSDSSMPVYRKVKFTRALFMKLWGFERHLARLETIQNTILSGVAIDPRQVNGGTDYPEPLLLVAFGLLNQKYRNDDPILDESLLREIYGSIWDAYNKLVPLISDEPVPKTADEFYNRGNARIRQERYDEALSDFNTANEMEPNNSIFEFTLGQYWLRCGRNNKTALIWIEKAISHIHRGALFTEIFHHQLRMEVCVALGKYCDALESLHIVVGRLRYFIESLTWHDGEASISETQTVYAEGIMHSLVEVSKSAEQLLTVVDGTLAQGVRNVLREIKKLRKEL